MKKIFALILTLALAFSLTAVHAFAVGNTLDNTTHSASQDVKATYNAGASTETVCSVTISWGAMAFTYNAGAWNPNTHAYDASWKATDDSNTVTVTNHSNTDINAKLTYNAATNYAGITGTFSNDSLHLLTAVGTDVSKAPSETVTLTLSGILNSNTPAGTTIGTVTVTLD